MGENNVIVSERLALFVTEIQSLEARLATLLEERADYLQEIQELKKHIVLLEERIKLLESKITVDTKPTPTPPTPPIPDVKITFNGVIFSPSTPGEYWPLSGEYRWNFDADNEISIILDQKLTQSKITIQRAWADLPLNAPVREAHVKVVIDNKVHHNDRVKIHHHQRTAKTFNRLPFSRIDISSYISQGILPNYDLNSIIPPSVNDLSSWQGKQWHELYPLSDRWSESYGVIVRSWTGGEPLANEASMFAPWDIYLLSAQKYLTDRQRLYEICSNTWDSAGNYPIHFYDRATRMPCRPDDKALYNNIPKLNSNNLPSLVTVTGPDKTKDTLPLPKCDIAHDFGLVNFAALITGERFYVEALESFTLLGPLCLEPEERSTGTYFSGEVRASAWWLRNLYHLHLCYSQFNQNSIFFGRGLQILNQLKSTLQSWNDQFVNPTSKNHYATGLLDYTPGRDVAWTRNAANKALLTLSGNHYFLIHVLKEIYNNLDFESLVAPILRHMLKVPEGVWRYSLNPHTTPWLQHAAGSRFDSWQSIILNTFAKGLPIEGKFHDLVTPDIAAWYRAAVIAALEIGDLWAEGAFKFIDEAIRASGKNPSISWMIKPRTDKSI